MFMYKYLQDILTTLCFSSQKPILFSSVVTSQVKNPLYTVLYSGMFCLIQANLMARAHLVFTAWPQLADTTIPPKLYNPVSLNINTTHTPYNEATAAIWLLPVYGYGQSMVAVNL